MSDTNLLLRSRLSASVAQRAANVPGVAEVTVSAGAAGTYTVTVADGPRTTRHTVRVPDGFATDLGCPLASGIELVRHSFSFLLEREPSSSILGTFSLEQIGNYFPEYRHTIRDIIRNAPAGDTSGDPATG
jgi:hypothetical protein